MLLKDFYKIEEREEIDNVHVFRLFLNPKHEIYKGHFPDFPIMPGVCSMQIVKECASLVLGQEIQHKEIKTCKFVSAVNPNENSSLLLKLKLSDPTDGIIVINANIEAADKIVLKFKSHSILK
ncbi:MAG: hypothetical protein WBG43_05390 [Marinifilaceae bacterium]